MMGGQGGRDAIPALQSQQVRLMTIHASKGLQFEHVIVPFMSKKCSLTMYVPVLFDAQLCRWSVAIKNKEEKSQHSIGGEQIRYCLNEREKQEHYRFMVCSLLPERKKHWLLPTTKNTHL